LQPVALRFILKEETPDSSYQEAPFLSFPARPGLVNFESLMPEENTILVVEDNDFVRLQIVSYLKEASYSILEAGEGEAALAIMQSNHNINLAIVDIRMEPVGGFEFIKRLRSREIETPVILVTGDQTPDILEQAGKFGVSAVLMKPVEKKRLMGTVERVLHHAKRGRQ
jgi:CheY-like chemotaxis protein